ncbi:MAG: DUF308 domain-containing protein [Clostridia bacterium]|nr:DUF308 domain-containing protein [Clostridia bacterium]
MSKRLGRAVTVMNVITAVVTIAIGASFCISFNNATDTINTLMGIVLIIAGCLNIALFIVNNQSLINGAGIWSALLIALGIYFIQAQPVNLLINFIPWVLIAMGALFVVDALLGLFRKEGFPSFILGVIIGLAALALGICLVSFESFRNVSSLIFGIIIVLYGVFQLVSAFTNRVKVK